MTHTYTCTEGHYHDGNRKDGSSCPDAKRRPTPRDPREKIVPVTQGVSPAKPR